MAIHGEQVRATVARLGDIVAELAELPLEDVPADVIDDVLAGVESAQRRLSVVSYDAINALRKGDLLGRGKRLRDHLANLLHLSAIETAARIATARDLGGPAPALAETAAAARHGLISAEHVRIIRDTIAKLARPGMCNATDTTPTVDGDPNPETAAGDLRTTRQRNHDALKAGLRALLASGDLGTHRGLPVTAIVTMTLQQLESASGVALTGGGSTVPMEVAIRMAAHAQRIMLPVDPSRQPKANRLHRRPNRPRPEPDAA